MRKFIALSLAFILVLLTLTGCSDPMAKYEELPDEYVEGTDFMNGFNRNENFRQSITKGEGGYYFTRRGFLYFYDTASKVAVPVCSRPECLHDQNPDDMTIWSCDAWIPCADNFMQYYDGFLYATCDMYSEKGELMLADSMYLLKIAPDRSTVEALTPIDLPNSASCFIHRGYLYAFPRSSNNGETLQITRYSLVDPKSEPLVILELEADGFIQSAYPLGNHIYFTSRISNTKLYALNIQTLECTELDFELEYDSSLTDSYDSFMLCGIYQNKLLLQPQSYLAGVGLRYTDLYLYDPKTAECEAIFDLRPYSSDGSKKTTVVSDGSAVMLYEAIDNDSLTISPFTDDFSLRGDSCTFPFSYSFASCFFPCDASFSFYIHDDTSAVYLIDRENTIQSTLLMDSDSTVIHVSYGFSKEDFAFNAIYNPLL